jgi:hypothetical protein
VFCTSRKTSRSFVTETNRLVLLREILEVCQNQEFLNVKEGDTQITDLIGEGGRSAIAASAP